MSLQIVHRYRLSEYSNGSGSTNGSSGSPACSVVSAAVEVQEGPRHRSPKVWRRKGSAHTNTTNLSAPKHYC